jgi:hypothetical protein
VAEPAPTSAGNRPLKVGLMLPDTERTGDPEFLAETLRGYAHAGISHVQVVLDPNTIEGVEMFARVLEHLDSA